ncbi:MAG: FtsX-like permease family protein [Burkholderiaceae bacterium]|nr:FtsX-like permease family protein [Burkholderiaceae bacterium]
MPIALLFRLAWRNLVRNLRRSVFGIATIAFGVVGLALAAGFIQDVFEQLGEATISAQLGHVQIAKRGFREGGTASPQDFLIDAASLKPRIAALDLVKEVMGRLAFSGLLSLDGAELAIEAQGIEPDPEARLGTRLQILAGRGLRDADTYGVLLGEGVAKQLKAGVHDTVSLTAPTIDGSLNLLELEVLGVFRSFSKEYDDRTIRVPLAAAHELTQTDRVNTLVVQLRRTADTDLAVARLTASLGDSDLEAVPWYVLSDFYANTRLMYERQFGFLQLIALVLVVMSVLNSLNMTVFERTAEFGTMRVLGNRGSAVVKLIVIEGLLLGVLGSLIGILLAMLVAAVVSVGGIPMPPPPNMESGYTARVVLTLPALGRTALIGTLAAVLASVIPALRFLRIPLPDALRRAV